MTPAARRIMPNQEIIPLDALMAAAYRSRGLTCERRHTIGHTTWREPRGLKGGPHEYPHFSLESAPVVAGRCRGTCPVAAAERATRLGRGLAGPGLDHRRAYPPV